MEKKLVHLTFVFVLAFFSVCLISTGIKSEPVELRTPREQLTARSRCVSAPEPSKLDAKAIFEYVACCADSRELTAKLSGYQLINLKLDTLTNEEGQHPLHVAVMLGKLDIVQLMILELRVDPNLPDRGGWTALHYACQVDYYRPDMLLFLLQLPDINTTVQDHQMVCPLHYFVRLDPHHTLGFEKSNNWKKKKLIKKKKKEDILENNFFTALVMLCGKDRSNVHRVNKNGETPLMLAVWKGHPNVVHVLLKHTKKLKLQIINKKGFSALHFAVIANKVESAELLTKTDPSLWSLQTTDNPVSPKELAEQYERTEILEIWKQRHNISEPMGGKQKDSQQLKKQKSNSKIPKKNSKTDLLDSNKKIGLFKLSKSAFS